MFTRIVEITVQRGKAKELTTTINDQILPILRKQKGFVDELVLISNTEPERVVGISLWQTQQDAETYHRDQFGKVQELIKNLVTTAPTVRTFDVETSTAHKLTKGKAA